jgi:hypothetical protein
MAVFKISPPRSNNIFPPLFPVALGAGTMRAMGATAHTGKIPRGHSPHGHFPRIYAPVTKIHRPSSILIFTLNIETKLKFI